MKLTHYFQAGIATLAIACAFPASAVTVISVQSGGITLDSSSTATAGSSGAPWLIGETMTSSGTLKFLGDPDGPLAPGNSTGTSQDEGKWISKTVVNNSGVDWTSFELELQVILGTPSPDGDGLSFAQGGGLVFTSDKFGTYTAIDDTKDYLNFHGGLVSVGESVTFNFAITDNAANNPFYLLQTANVVDLPEPGSMLLLGLGLAGMGFMRRRKSA